MRTFVRQTLSVAALAAAIGTATPARAQAPSVNGLGDVILELARSTPTPTQQRILDQLFSGRIDATIVDGDGNNANFGDADLILFALSPVSLTGVPLTRTGNRADFNQWVEQNAEGILAILFPGSLTESTSGIDVAQSHAQAFLVSTALAAGSRGAIGGRAEFESFDVEGASGKSIQGLFRMRDIAIEGRYAQLSNSLNTKSTNVGVNYHPSWVRGDSENEVRVGGDGYFSALFSRSRSLDLGSFDYGAGVWASGKRSFEKVSVSFGGVLLGSKTYIPLGLIGDDFDFVAQTINDRSLRWDLTYGGAVHYPLSDFWAIGAKLLQSASLKSPLDEGRTSQLLLVSLAYLIGGDRPIDFGYRFSSGGERYQAHGIFMNANFGF